MRQLILQYLKTGQFYEIVDLTKDLTINEICLILKKIAYQEGIIAYTYTCFLISLNNNAEYHAFAAHLFALPLCSINSASSSGLFHAREAVKLNPNDIKNKELLLYFNRVPEQPLEKEEAIHIALEIINEKPDSEAAKEVLVDYKII